MKLVAPLPPNIANGRMHWRVKLNRKKQYWESVDSWRIWWRWPHPKKASKRARISATLFVYSLMDDDNAMARVKWLLDYLVAWEYLPGDSRKHIRWAGLPDQKIDRKNQRIEIEIEEF